jgi:hypothetical protein
MRLNGKQTIYQMMQLAARIRERGGEAKEPLWYKHEYLRRLDLRIKDRIDGLRQGTIPADDLLVHGARRLLENLKDRGLPVYLASGTDEIFVNALPPLKVVQLLGNACLSPTTLAPKDPFRSRVEIAPHELFSLFSEEPHRVTSNDLVGALGAIPAAWFATSHDVTTRLMFSSGADSFSPANRRTSHYQRASRPIARRESVVYQGRACGGRHVHFYHHWFKPAEKPA